MTRPTSKQLILDALPGTIPQIIAKSGAARSTVFHWIAILRDESKCHVKRWRRTAGMYSPYIAIGEGVDAKKPEPRTSAEHSHKHYIKHRRDLEKELRASRKAARESVAKARKSPKTWLSALGAP